MSLRLRLALWYGGLTGLVVALVSLLAYAVHSRAHYDYLDGVLVGAAEHVAEEYAAAATSHDRAAIFSVPLAPNLVARLYDDRGEVIQAAPNTDLMPPLDLPAVLVEPVSRPFDPIVGLAPAIPGFTNHGRLALVSASNGNRWRLYLLPVDSGAHRLVVGAPLTDVDTSVAAFRRLVPLLAVVGAVLAFTFARLVAGRALRPVATLTETAGTIAHSRSFSQRVPGTSGRDELGSLAATFNQMLDSLEQAYETQRRFVADASHELRAPLTAIQANLELLRRRPAMPEDQRQEAVTEASREADRLVRLVADLLALARADAGQTVRQVPVELDRVLLDALGEARHLAQGQRLEVAQLEPALVRGDPDRLKQAFLIVLDNAIKYTSEDRSISLSLRRNGRAAQVTIQDEGVGISPADLPHVFERFYRADPARARDPGGTGLGLPIAHWIVEQHGGEIHVSSRPGQGTTVQISLPLNSS